MNREEAKLILQVYRPGGQDADDPQFAEALALAKQDPELAAWFAEQQKFDAFFSGGLQQVRVPGRLKPEILACEKDIEPQISIWWRNQISWRSPAVWAMAAVILIYLGLAVFWKRPENPARFADYREQMIQASENEVHHIDVEIHDLKQAETWLAGHQAGTNFDLPPGLRDTRGMMGCRVLDWHGQKVSMLCFMLEGSKHVDLFVAELDDVPDAPSPDEPQFTKTGERMTVSWTENGRVYLLTGRVDEEFLRHCLQPAATARAFFGRQSA
jgi:hypothetical protein